MAEASLKLGGSWATKEGSLLGFNDENGNYKPIPFDFTRATTATRVNRDGLIEEVQSGVPRIDFSNGDGSLLLEPQRTNLVPNSENFSAGSWTKTNVSITSNATTSPKGIDNAAKITENTSGLNLYAPSDTLSGSASDYTYSVFLKEGSLRYGGLRAINNGFANRFFVNVDLQEGTVADTETVGSGVTWTYGVESFSDGWYRVWITGTNTSGNIDIAVGLSNSATPNYASGLPYYTGTGSDYIYAWGAQLEAGSYATSYIPTSGSAVTRNGDFCEKTSASSYIGQTEGTMYWEGSFQPNSNPILLQLTPDSGNYTKTIYIEYANSSIRMRVYDSHTQQAFFSVSATAGTEYKIALAYKENDIKGYVNGASIGTATSATIQSGLNNIYVGKLRGTTIQDFNGTIPKQVILYKTRLSNTELAELTTI